MDPSVPPRGAPISMANLGTKDGILHVRFRFDGKEYKKSLKTRSESAAQAALHMIELTIHRLLTGQVRAPQGVGLGDFILSGGTMLKPKEAEAAPQAVPDLRTLAEEYEKSVRDLLAPSYLYSQAMHLRHLMRHLGKLADLPIDRVGFRDLDGFLKARLATRHPNTAERERISLLQFFKWTVQQGYLTSSPASGLTPIKIARRSARSTRSYASSDAGALLTINLSTFGSACT